MFGKFYLYIVRGPERLPIQPPTPTLREDIWQIKVLDIFYLKNLFLWSVTCFGGIKNIRQIHNNFETENFLNLTLKEYFFSFDTMQL